MHINTHTNPVKCRQGGREQKKLEEAWPRRPGNYTTNIHYGKKNLYILPTFSFHNFRDCIKVVEQ